MIIYFKNFIIILYCYKSFYLLVTYFIILMRIVASLQQTEILYFTKNYSSHIFQLFFPNPRIEGWKYFFTNFNNILFQSGATRKNTSTVRHKHHATGATLILAVFLLTHTITHKCVPGRDFYFQLPHPTTLLIF